MFVRNTHIDVKPENLETYRRLLLQQALYAKRMEPAIKRFDLLENWADKNCLHTLEVYTDRAAWESYSAQDYVCDFAKATEALCNPPSPIDGLSEARNLEPLDEEFNRQALTVAGNKHTLYIHNAWIYLAPEHRESYIHDIVEEIRHAKPLERGIVDFHLYQELANPNILHTYEVYRSKPVWQHHYEQPYLKEFHKKNGHKYAPEMRQQRRSFECTNLEPPDEHWFAARYPLP